jgi:hypothetical protein
MQQNVWSAGVPLDGLSSQTLTVVCDVVLQPSELAHPALGGARDELRPQLIAGQGPRLNVPIHSHVVVQATCDSGLRGVGGVRVGESIAK